MKTTTKAVVVAALAPWLGCTPGPRTAADVRERLGEAAAAAARAERCAAELGGVVEGDPEAAARILRVAPIRLVPHGGAGRGQAALHEIVAERVAGARDDAAAARSLAALAADGSEEIAALAVERAERSLSASRGLCLAADELREVLAAHGR